MKQDRFLLGILVFIGLLVIAALVLFFTRHEAQNYTPENTPEGVMRNYVLALHDRDYQRAYSYMAEKENKPTFDYFRQAFLSHQLDVSGAAIQVGKVEVTDSGEATIDISIIYASNGPFMDTSRSTATASLVKQEGAWRISYMPYPYWGWDWYQPTPVK